jgi:hypothetical protein
MKSSPSLEGPRRRQRGRIAEVAELPHHARRVDDAVITGMSVESKKLPPNTGDPPRSAAGSARASH